MKIRPKLVVDTNIFVSGLINKKGACRKLIDHYLHQNFELVACKEIYSEYEFVLLHSNLISREEALQFLQILKSSISMCKIENVLDVCSDKSDNKFLEAAIESDVELLVTKNIKDYPIKQYQNVKIVRISKTLKYLESL